jgi:hypothetical protein
MIHTVSESGYEKSIRVTYSELQIEEHLREISKLLRGGSIRSFKVEVVPFELLNQTEARIMIEDTRYRVAVWKARREGNIDDPIASAVYALEDRYPSGWGLNTLGSCLKLIEDGVSPSIAAEQA